MKRMLAMMFFLTASLHGAEPIELFNGKDFSGWTFDIIDSKADPATIWMVKDGIIICTGRPPGVMRSDKEFSDYELIVEWRWAPDTKPGNSGVLIHASTPREMFVWPKSIEVQLAAGNAGDFWMIGEQITVADAQADGRRWVKKGESAENPAGQWNTARIRSEGAEISVWINGKLMNQATSAITKKGAICLQSEGGELHFRKVQLTPIE